MSCLIWWAVLSGIKVSDLHLADDLFRPVAQDARGAFIKDENIAQHVVDDDAVHGGLHQHALQFVQLAHLGLQIKHLGDVPEGAHRPGGLMAFH